jgi:urate oxidase
LVRLAAFCLKYPTKVIHYHSVLKTSGSAFENFFKDEYTTLVPVNDRIFSTSVDLAYTFSPVQLSSPKDDRKLEFAVPDGEDLIGGTWDGTGVAERARKITLEVFATDESASVQVSANL